MVDTIKVFATRGLCIWIFTSSLSGWIFCGGDSETFPKLIKQTSNIIKLCPVRHRKEQPDLSSAQQLGNRTALPQTRLCSVVPERRLQLTANSDSH